MAPPYKLRSPWMHSIVLTTATTVYNLLTLCLAISPAISQFAKSVQLQVDVGAGAAKVYVGSPDSLAANDCGVSLVATQVLGATFYSSSGLELGDFALMADTNATQVNVVIIV